MRHYTDVVQDRNGNAVSGATVTVKNYPSLTTATVYGSNAVGSNVNPLTTDANGRFEFWAPNGRYSLVVSKTGITTTTQSDVQIVDLPPSIAEYGAVGDGTTDDTAAFQAAATALRAAGGGTISLEAGKTYKLFTGVVSQTFALDLTNCTNVVIEGNGASITSGLTDTAVDVNFIYASAVNGLRVSNIKFTGGNTVLGSGATGEKFIRYNGGTKNIFVSNVDVRNCYGGIVCLQGDNSTQNYGVVLLNGYFQQCFYPLTPQLTDNVFARYKSVNGGRVYFPVAPCANHDITVDSQSGFTSADCLLNIIASSTATVAQNTISNVRINYTMQGRYSGAGNMSDGTDGIILLKVKQASGVSAAGHFRNIRINFSMDAGSGSDKPGRIVNFMRADSSNAADTSVRNHTFRDIVISGSAINWNNAVGSGIVICDEACTWTSDSIENIAVRDVLIAGAAPVNALYANAQGAVANVPFLTVEDFYADGTISYANATGACISEKNIKASGLDATDIPPTSYSPAWTGSGSNPAIGNGSVTGRYKKNGRDVEITIVVVPGGTTTFGTGTYSLSLPITAAADSFGAIGSAEAFESGVAYHQGTCRVTSGAATMFMEFGGGDHWGSATPWTFKNGDNVVATIRYRCA